MIDRRALLLVLALAAAGCATDPPVQEMSDARQAITAAEDADAARFAPVPLSEARRSLEQAENQIANGSYGLARNNAIRAKNRAVAAMNASQALQDQ